MIKVFKDEQIINVSSIEPHHLPKHKTNTPRSESLNSNIRYVRQQLLLAFILDRESSARH